MKQIYIALIALAFIFVSCTKEANCIADTTCIDGTIQWGGEPAVDGLGWYFQSDEFAKPVKLKNLSSAYEVDDLPVSVCLKKTTEKYQCFCGEPLDVYEIKSIRQR